MHTAHCKLQIKQCSLYTRVNTARFTLAKSTLHWSLVVQDRTQEGNPTKKEGDQMSLSQGLAKKGGKGEILEEGELSPEVRRMMGNCTSVRIKSANMRKKGGRNYARWR